MIPLCGPEGACGEECAVCLHQRLLRAVAPVLGGGLHWPCMTTEYHETSFVDSLATRRVLAINAAFSGHIAPHVKGGDDDIRSRRWHAACVRARGKLGDNLSRSLFEGEDDVDGAFEVGWLLHRRPAGPPSVIGRSARTHRSRAIAGRCAGSSNRGCRASGRCAPTASISTTSSTSYPFGRANENRRRRLRETRLATGEFVTGNNADEIAVGHGAGDTDSLVKVFVPDGTLVTTSTLQQPEQQLGCQPGAALARRQHGADRALSWVGARVGFRADVRGFAFDGTDFQATDISFDAYRVALLRCESRAGFFYPDDTPRWSSGKGPGST